MNTLIFEDEEFKQFKLSVIKEKALLETAKQYISSNQYADLKLYKINSAIDTLTNIEKNLDDVIDDVNSTESRTAKNINLCTKKIEKYRVNCQDVVNKLQKLVGEHIVKPGTIHKIPTASGIADVLLVSSNALNKGAEKCKKNKNLEMKLLFPNGSSKYNEEYLKFLLSIKPDRLTRYQRDALNKFKEKLNDQDKTIAETGYELESADLINQYDWIHEFEKKDTDLLDAFKEKYKGDKECTYKNGKTEVTKVKSGEEGEQIADRIRNQIRNVCDANLNIIDLLGFQSNAISVYTTLKSYIERFKKFDTDIRDSKNRYCGQFKKGYTVKEAIHGFCIISEKSPKTSNYYEIKEVQVTDENENVIYHDSFLVAISHVSD